MPDPTDTQPDADMVLAGQYALRVLEGAELSFAQRRILSDAAFATAVEWWDRKFALLGEAGSGISPSPELRETVLNRIASEASRSSDIVELPNHKPFVSPWSIVLAAWGTTMAVGAAVVIFFALPPDATMSGQVETVAQADGPSLVARFENADGTAKLAGLVDRTTGQIMIRAYGLSPAAGEIVQLWVIPEGGAPRPFGALSQAGTLTRPLAKSEAGLFVAGNTLAVTYEMNTGIPNKSPTTPILLSGVMEQV